MPGFVVGARSMMNGDMMELLYTESPGRIAIYQWPMDSMQRHPGRSDPDYAVAPPTAAAIRAATEDSAPAIPAAIRRWRRLFQQLTRWNGFLCKGLFRFSKIISPRPGFPFFISYCFDYLEFFFLRFPVLFRIS